MDASVTMEVTGMAKTLERPRATPQTPVRSSRWAWLAFVVYAALYPLAIAVALAEQDTGRGDLVFIAWTLLLPAVGIALGVRSGRTGNRWGALATAFGSAWLTFVVVFYLGANYILAEANDSVSAALAVTMAVIVGGAVEAAWYRWFHAGRQAS